MQYKIIIAYDGTDFSGWLQQPDQPSIAQTIENVFEKVYKKPIRLLGASKTDSGVHALGQVAIFETDIEVESQKMRWAWNNALPESISILSLEPASDFNPLSNVQEKTYHYSIFMSRPLPFIARYGWEYPYPFDIKKLKEALELFVGTHDFHAFYTGDEKGLETIRTINAITLERNEEQDAYRVVVKGQKFMHHMVRRIVGAALHVAAGKADCRDIQDALCTRTIKYFLPTAPAKGLMLHSIEYAD